jgi:hypothetical protein
MGADRDVTSSRLPSWWSNRDVNVSYAGYRFPRGIIQHAIKVFLHTAVLCSPCSSHMGRAFRSSDASTPDD